MKKNVTKAKFNFNGRTLYDLLGGENIETDSIAIAEQIKNSRDANATDVTIDFSKMEENIITITDNGQGMSLEEIHDNWLTIGTSSKINDSAKLGGKGVGRFSLFRLADKISIKTSKENITYNFTIDKKSLEKNSLSDINIFQEYTNKKLGTQITLTELSKTINLYEIERGIENLVHPEHNKIHKIIYPDSYQQKDYLSPRKFLDQAPFHAVAIIEGMNIKEYKFNCLIKGETYYTNNQINNNFLSTLNKTLSMNFANNINLGEIKIEIYNFFFDRPFLSWHKGIEQTKIKNEMLEAYQGISVYRNGYKIFGHGEEDWLKLAELRLKRPGDNIDNKSTYGLVTLDPVCSISLKEKTNREGFIKSPEYTYFHETVLCIVKQVGADRRESIRNIRKLIKGNPVQPIGIRYNPDQTKKLNKAEKTVQLNNENETKKTKQTSKTDEAKNTGKTVENYPKDNNTSQTIKTDFTEQPGKKDATKKPNPVSPNKIIDISFGYSEETPHKIKDIIEELKRITNKNINSQALLLRCLIDISTQYYQTKNDIDIKKNNLPGNIRIVLNTFSDNKLLDLKAINRVRQSINKENTLQYFNGVAHDYNYRANFSDLVEIWNTFEPYITACIKP
ncbi:MAG TPA: ATP-binding protein [Cerasibacillus sp.]|uniref:ATP-binding protein n=1 Tax=Cerasibacillus sp. TaxID=2498711 RepID=UPI002F3F5276